MRWPIALVAALMPAQAYAEPMTGHVGHQGMDHGVQDHGTMEQSPHVPPQPPPPPPPDSAASGPANAADSVWGAEAMRKSRAALPGAHGGAAIAGLRIDRLEARIGESDGYLWDVKWATGGDLDRFVLKSEGIGDFGGPVEHAEVQALWSHAVGPYFDLQLGLRQDLERGGRTHAVLGIEGLAPFEIEIDADAFLSDKGDVTASVEAAYDQRITQRLILQPRAEVELAAQDIAEQRIGAGVVGIIAGLRLRYEITRQFAPYIGYGNSWSLGETRRIIRAAGEDASSGTFVVGLHAWF